MISIEVYLSFSMESVYLLIYETEKPRL